MRANGKNMIHRYLFVILAGAFSSSWLGCGDDETGGSRSDAALDASVPDGTLDASEGSDGGRDRCLDVDGDGYGEGPDCLGSDCDDQDGACHEGACCNPTASEVPGGPLATSPVVGCEFADRPARRDPDAHEVCEAVGDGRCWYVDPNGTEGAAGTFDDPFLKPQEAVWVAGPGDVIYLRGGVYTEVNSHVTGPVVWNDPDSGLKRGFISIRRILLPDWAGGNPPPVASGTEEAPITIRSFPNERACATGAGNIVVDTNNAEHDLAYWNIESLTLHQGTIWMRGGTKDADGNLIHQVHDIHVRYNEVFEYSARGTSNVGLVKADRGQWGGPRNIIVESNILHDVLPIDPDGVTRDWATTEDPGHFGAVATLSCERYIDPECVGNGALTIRNNYIYHVPQMVFLKNPSIGPILIEGNVAHDIRYLGNWTSANVTFRGNLVFHAGGGAKSGGEVNQDGEGSIYTRNGQNMVFEGNTIIGLSQIVFFRVCASGHTITGNVFQGMRLTLADADWNHLGYVGQAVSPYFPDTATTIADSQLADNLFDDNCFVTEVQNFLAFGRRYEENGEVRSNYMAIQDAQTILGHEVHSDIASDPRSVFVDFEGQDYRLSSEDGPCGARGAHIPDWWVQGLVRQ